MTVGGVTTDYAYDGTMLVREFQINQQTGLLAPSVTYMAGPMGPCCRINEQNQSEGYYPAGVTSTTPLTRGVTRWYVYDGLGSVIGELDANNNMTTSRQYDVYGAPRAGTQQGVAATSSQGYVGSLGHVTDASTGGLIYMQARYYDPSLGRFVSEDPGKCESNWYVYAGGDPVNMGDLTGCDYSVILTIINEAIKAFIQNTKAGTSALNYLWTMLRNMKGGGAAVAADGSAVLAEGEVTDASGGDAEGIAEEAAGAAATETGIQAEVDGIAGTEDLELTLELDFGDADAADDGGQQVMQFE